MTLRVERDRTIRPDGSGHISATKRNNRDVTLHNGTIERHKSAKSERKLTMRNIPIPVAHSSKTKPKANIMFKRLLLALIFFLSFGGIVFSSEDKKNEMHKEPPEVLSDQDLDDVVTGRMEMIKKAAERGSAGAQHILGDSYYHGEDLPQNYNEAFKWYKKSAEQGYDESQYNLGGMYYKGKGVAQNYTEAIKWFKKAAEQGDVEAQFALGGMYYNGEGVPQNYIEGYVWLRIASAKGHKDAMHNLYVIKSKMTPEQLAEAKKRAEVLWEKINKNN